MQEAKEAASTSASEVEQLKALVAEQEEKLLEADNERRKMHNTIQELRGNIRVYVRVRPFLSSDKGVDVGFDGVLSRVVLSIACCIC